MWELDYKESWALKNWCFWTVVLEKTHESPLHCKIKPVNPKGNQPWIFFGRTDAEAPILWPDNGKDLLIGKEETPMPRKTEGRRMRGRQRMRWLDGITDQWTWVWASSGSWWWTRKPGVHGVAELDTTEQLNWTDWLSSEAKLGFFFCPTSRAVVNVGNRLPPQVTFHVDSFSATVFKCTFPQLTHREEKDKILLFLDTTTIDRGLPWWLSCQRICLYCRRPGFDPLDPWFRKIPWRRKWQPTPVLLPGKFPGQRSLVGYSLWDPNKLDTTEWLHFHFLFFL